MLCVGIKLYKMFDKEVYISRRDALCRKVAEGIILLPGNSESPANYPNNAYRFRQDSTFLYYFGLDHPDYVGIIDVDSGESILFGDDYTLDDIIWMGPQPAFSDVAIKAGVSYTRSMDKLKAFIAESLKKGRKIHFLPPYRADVILLLSSLLRMVPEAVASAASVELAKAVVSMREIKDSGEIAQIDEACGIASQMHCMAMKMCRPGIKEQKIAGAIESVALQYGAGVSFYSIVSQNGETLHNHYHGNILESGKLLLVDAGAETNMNYCSDFTRTFPVNGKFTSRQKAVYDIVLAANENTFRIAAPGSYYWEMHNAASRIIAEGLIDLGIMRGNANDIVAVGAQALFMPHGLGHQMGLDVHDMENIGERYVGYDEETLRSSTPGLSSLRIGKRLKEGMVITVELGIYFIPALIAKWKEEKLGNGFIDFSKAEEYCNFGGIRIEDDMLITSTGNRMLGNCRPPVTTAEIEDFMGQ